VIVLDASAALELLLQTPLGIRIADRTLAAEESMHAPHLLDIEVTQVLRRYTLAGELSADRAEQGLNDFTGLPLTRYAHSELLSRVWDLRDSLTAYDAIYVALAEALEAPLVTTDRKLARAHGHGARIELMS
jgi:predicted nucleic acid-binding protein